MDEAVYVDEVHRTISGKKLSVKKKNPAVKTQRNVGKRLQKTAKILYSASEIETAWGCPFPMFRLIQILEEDKQ